MTFTLQILITSAIFCVFILALLIVQKKGYLKYKIVSFFMTLASVLFLCAALFFGYSEFTSYKERVKRYAKNDTNSLEKKQETPSNDIDISAFKYFQEYRNSLNGYALFLLDISQNSAEEQLSYQETLKNKIITQFINEEYTQTYWNKVFNIVYKHNDSTNTYARTNYEVMYIIPKNYEYRELNEEYGDLNNPKNFSYFENACNLIYLEGKIKAFDIRSAKYIEAFWQQNKAFIYTFFSKNKYDQLCKQVVNDLITVHDRIVAQPDYKTFYKEYDVSDDDFLDFPSKEFTRSYKYSWPFSFWDRRFGEENSEQVYRILKEIQQHYSN